MISTLQHKALGVTFDIKQMSAVDALRLQESALKRKEASYQHIQDGDYLSALAVLLDDNEDDTTQDPFLKLVRLNDEVPDYDSLFAGRYEELAKLLAAIIDANYGFLYGTQMFLGPDGQDSPEEEATPAAVQRAQAKFSQPQMIYSVIMSDKRLATLHELQTIYNLEDLYKLYECVAFERHTTDIYRKKAEQQRNQ
ncbi:hypothetical protein [Pseudomonas kurunegalensis]|uniref:hypothetical protein n=1 Tax=Pseudomonas kurunegalensis TaxID=485880 RepID=UPI003D805352